MSRPDRRRSPAPRLRTRPRRLAYFVWPMNLRLRSSRPSPAHDSVGRTQRSSGPCQGAAIHRPRGGVARDFPIHETFPLPRPPTSLAWRPASRGHLLRPAVTRNVPPPLLECADLGSHHTTRAHRRFARSRGEKDRQQVGSPRGSVHSMSRLIHRRSSRGQGLRQIWLCYVAPI